MHSTILSEKSQLDFFPKLCSVMSLYQKDFEDLEYTVHYWGGGYIKEKTKIIEYNFQENTISVFLL